MVTFSTALDTALRQPGGRLLGFFEAQWPDATRYYGHAGVGSTAGYLPLVRSFGPLVEQPSNDRSGRISTGDFELEVIDQDQTIKSLLESANGDDVFGSVGILRGGAAGVAVANWAELFRGVLVRVSIRDRVARLTYRQDDQAIEALVPDPGWRIGRQFPYAAPDVVGKLAPIIYGSFDSLPYTNLGMIPGLLVDTTGNKRHLVCAGYAKDVPRVWKNESEQTVSTHYTIAQDEIGGRRYTLIEWTAAASVADSDAITCDVDGVEATGDGSGSLLTDPADELEHFLINFVFDQYQRGNYATSSNQVDSSSFTTLASYFAARSYTAAMYIEKRQKASDLIAEWCISNGARAWWDYPGAGSAGKVTVGVEDYSLADWSSEPWLPAYVLEGSSPAFDQDDWLRRADGVDVKSVWDPSQGNYLRHYTVTQLARTAPTEDSLEMRWGSVE